MCGADTEVMKGVVVFDGYTDEPSIKSTEHARRISHTSANVTVSETMTVTANPEMFLCNMPNKKQFIQMLGAHLEASGSFWRGYRFTRPVNSALEGNIA